MSQEITGISRLMVLGVFGRSFHDLQHQVISNPNIMVFLGLNRFQQQRSLVASVSSKLNVQVKKQYILEILKYLASMIGADNNLKKEEKAFFTLIRNELFFAPTKQEYQNIREAFFSRYLGPVDNNGLEDIALKRLLIWLLGIMSNVDNQNHELEKQYIEQVGKHLLIADKDLIFIRNQINPTHSNYNNKSIAN